MGWGLRVLVGATSVSQVGRGTGRVDGFGKVRPIADGFRSIPMVVKFESTVFLFALPIHGAAIIVFESHSIALGVLARPFVWGARVVGRILGCHGCFPSLS